MSSRARERREMDGKGESRAGRLGITLQDVYARRYDETDITALENGDLTDLKVELALGVAYEQSDPEAGNPNVVLHRDPGEVANGSAEELGHRLGDIERKLKERPKNAFLRTQRAAILCSLARREAARARRTGHAASPCATHRASQP